MLTGHSYHVTLVEPAGYPHWRALAEVRDLLAASLRDLGCAVTSGPQFVVGRVNVLLGYHLLKPADIVYLKSYGVQFVVYQLEQLSDREGWWNADRAAVLRAADEVWDYAAANVRFLAAQGIAAKMLPLGYHPALERIAHLADGQKDIDVLFYGSMNERRKRVLDGMKAAGLRVADVFGVYGGERNALVARSRIVLNMHYYEAQRFEQVRVSYLLNNRAVVLSEGDERTCPTYAAEYGDLVDAAQRLLARWGSTKQDAEAQYEVFREHSMTDYLRLVLDKEPACAA